MSESSAVDPVVSAAESTESYYAHARPEILALVPTTTRSLLDIGCAEGLFGALAKRKRPELEVWGIEPVADAARVAAGRLDRVIEAPVEAALETLPDRGFDCATFNDSLEHLVDPWATLRLISRKLTATGCVVASVPNLRHFPVMQSLFLKGEFRYVDEGILDRTHLRFFTRSGVEELFERSGYRVAEITGLRPHRLPFWFSQVSKLMGRRFHDMQFLQYAIVAYPNEQLTAQPDEATAPTRVGPGMIQCASS